MRSALRRAAGPALALAGLGVFVPVPPPAGARQAPTPVYQQTGGDAVTADNAPARFEHPAGGCPSPGCVLPDANPGEGPTRVDSYTLDIYERPTTAGPAAVAVVALDVTSVQVGADPERLYFRIDLHGTDGDGGLPHAYSFELDYDVDAPGDVLVEVAGPRLGPSFSPAGVVVRWNRNSNIAGLNPGPDGPRRPTDGYEVLVLEEGADRLGRSLDGGEVEVRIAPDRSASLELAVRRSFLEALSDGEKLEKAAFRAGASAARVDHATYTLHDHLGRSEAGSPYPFLAADGAPSACPEADRGLRRSERLALDSGTPVPGPRANPCYPSRSLAGYDSTSIVTLDLESPEFGSRTVPDVAVSATHQGSLPIGGETEVLVSVRNVGVGPTTGPITLTDRLPERIRPLSATGTSWACSWVGRTVSCTRRLPLEPGGATAVKLRVAVERGQGERVTNRADVVTPGDIEVANNTAADVARLVRPARGSGRVLGVVAGGLALLAIAAWRYRRR